jgi:hypothetical protein
LKKLSGNSAVNVARIKHRISERENVVGNRISQRLYNFSSPIAPIDAALPTKVSKRSIDSSNKKVPSYSCLVVVLDCEVINPSAYFLRGVGM